MLSKSEILFLLRDCITKVRSCDYELIFNKEYVRWKSHDDFHPKLSSIELIDKHNICVFIYKDGLIHVKHS